MEEPTLNNVADVNGATQNPIQIPKKKMNVWKKIIITISSILICYFCLVLLLAHIAPILGLVALVPVFIFTDARDAALRSQIQSKFDSIEYSNVVLSGKLVETECFGFSYQNKLTDEQNAKVSSYIEKIGTVGEYYRIAVCETPKGELVFHMFGSEERTKVYLNSGNSLDEVIEFPETPLSYLVYTSEDGNVFILYDHDGQTGIPSYVVLDQGVGSFLKVDKTSDVITRCPKGNQDRCGNFRMKDVVIKDANYIPLEEFNEFSQRIGTSTLTSEQQQCYDAFLEKKLKGGRKVGINSLEFEPYASCINNVIMKPYDYELFYYKPTDFEENKGTDAFFDINAGRIVKNTFVYDGYTIMNFSKKSFAHFVFEKILSGEYKIGEKIPNPNNNDEQYITQQNWNWKDLVLRPEFELYTLNKRTYKNVDVYSMRDFSWNRYKVFVKNNTYVLLERSGLNVISEEKADSIINTMIDEAVRVAK
jgi:hypothetical protein